MITIRWDRPENSPVGATVLQEAAHTPAELRRLVTAARADPHVTAFRYRSVRQLDGPEPTHCNRGHAYRGGSATQARHDWLTCNCGGHHLITCRWPGCADQLITPPWIEDECDAEPPLEQRPEKG